MSVVRVKVVRMMTLLLVLLMLQVQVLCRLSFSRRRSLSCSHGCVVRVVVLAVGYRAVQPADVGVR